jgi:hypothetical protein
VVSVWDKWRIPRRAERVDGISECLIEVLVGDFLVVVDVFGDNAHYQLVQRVFDAFPVEGGHDDTPLNFPSGCVWAFVGGVALALPLSYGTETSSSRTLTSPHLDLGRFGSIVASMIRSIHSSPMFESVALLTCRHVWTLCRGTSPRTTFATGYIKLISRYQLWWTVSARERSVG